MNNVINDPNSTYFSRSKLVDINKKNGFYYFTFENGKKNISLEYDENDPSLFQLFQLLKTNTKNHLNFIEDNNRKYMDGITKKLSVRRLIIRIVSSLIIMLISITTFSSIFQTNDEVLSDVVNLVSSLFTLAAGGGTYFVTSAVHPKMSKVDNEAITKMEESYEKSKSNLAIINSIIKEKYHYVDVDKKRELVSNQSIVYNDYE